MLTASRSPSPSQQTRAGRPCSGTRARASENHLASDSVPITSSAASSVRRRSRGIAAQADPAVGADAAGEDRADVLGDEARHLAGARAAGELCLGSQAVAVLEHDRAAVAQRQQRPRVGGERAAHGGRVGGLAGRRGGSGLRRRPARRDVAVQRIVGGGLVGGDVERDAVVDQPRGDLGDVGDERDRAAVAAVLELGQRPCVIVGDDVDPAGLGPARRALGVDLDDQRAAAEVGDRQTLGAAHPAQPGGQHAAAGERTAEVAARQPRRTSRA